MNENKILYSFNYEGEDHSLEAICKSLKIPIEKCSKEFGAILIDPQDNRYCILVEASSLELNDPKVFANPKIQGFGYEEE